jgi:hypothetical protein
MVGRDAPPEEPIVEPELTVEQFRELHPEYVLTAEKFNQLRAEEDEGRASARIEHFKEAVHQLLNGHLDVLNSHLEESVAFLGAATVRVILGGPDKCGNPRISRRPRVARNVNAAVPSPCGG